MTHLACTLEGRRGLLSTASKKAMVSKKQAIRNGSAVLKLERRGEQRAPKRWKGGHRFLA